MNDVVGNRQTLTRPAGKVTPISCMAMRDVGIWSRKVETPYPRLRPELLPIAGDGMMSGDHSARKGVSVMLRLVTKSIEHCAAICMCTYIITMKTRWIYSQELLR